MTICIIDDNATVVAQLKRLLSEAGMRDSEAFTDPRRGLDWCLQSPPELVLLDYNMPDLDGLELLGRLRQDAGTRQVPVAMISGWAVDSMRLQALQAGACDVIAKPFIPEEVKLKVRNLLQLARRGDNRAADTAGAAVEDFGVVSPTHHDFPDQQTIRMLEVLATLRRDRRPQSLQRTACYASCIAKHCGMTAQQQALILRAAVFHDIGAWSVPDETLERSKPLDAQGRRLLAGQPAAGHALLRGFTSPVLRLAADIALTCQEHWDGTGRPRGLRGEDIPLAARIVALADLFEQMTGRQGPRDRVLSAATAAAVVQADEGSHFDPMVVRAFMQALPAIGRLMAT